ncbi:MAG: sulfite exporter TauE/SafE family protein [Solirubrobacteraceae bacterium]
MTVAVLALGALVAASVQAAGGLGFALVLTPVLFAFMRPSEAIVIVNVLGLLLNLLVLFGERRRSAIVWAEVAPILLAAVPGSVCGILLLQSVPKAALQIVIGLAVVGAVAARSSARLQRVHASATGPRAWQRLSLGVATGTLTTSTGVSGPLAALWLTWRGLHPHALRDSLSALFLGTGAIGAVTLLPLAIRTPPGLGVLAATAAGVVGGHAIGSRVFARLATPGFHRLVLAVILAAGVTSLVLGLAAV